MAISRGDAKCFERLSNIYNKLEVYKMLKKEKIEKDRKARWMIDNLKHLHYMFRYLLDNKKYDLTKTILQSFGEDSDIGELHTILMLIRPAFENHEIIGSEIQRLNEIFNRRIEILRAQPRELATDKNESSI